MKSFIVSIAELRETIEAASADEAAGIFVEKYFDEISPPNEWEVATKDPDGYCQVFTVYAQSEEKYDSGNVDGKYFEWTFVTSKVRSPRSPGR